MNTARTCQHWIEAVVMLAALSVAMNTPAATLSTPRPGDCIAGYEVDLKRLPEPDSTGTVDFSNMQLLSDRRLIVEQAGADSVYITLAGSSRLLSIRSDSMIIIEEGQPGFFSRCIIPEQDAPSDTDSVYTGTYLRIGTSDGIVFREYGHTNHRIEPIGRIISADGDTIEHCWRIISIRNGILESHTGASADSMIREAEYPDSATRKLEHCGTCDNSLSRSYTRQQYYAAGYRYPLLEIERHMVYISDIPADSSIVAYYFPPSAIALLVDEENEEIRKSLETPVERFMIPEQKSSPASSGLSVSNGELKISMLPTVTAGKSIATVSAPEAGELTIMVHAAGGACIKSEQFLTDQAGLRVPLDLSGYASGVYLVTARMNDLTASARIVKR